MTKHDAFDPEVQPEPDHLIAGLRVLLLVRAERDSIPLLAALRPVNEIEVQVMKRSDWPLQNTFSDGKSADLLLVDSDPGDKEDLSYIEALKSSGDADGCRIVALSPRGSDGAALHAFRAGAEDVLLKPINPDEARETFGRLKALGRVEPGSRSNVIVFAHVAGGAGATTFAVNSAYALAEASAPRGCCLLDLDVQFGSAGNLLDMNFASPVQELIDDPSRLDRMMFEGMLSQHDAIHILTSPRFPLPLNGLKPSTVTELIQLAKSKFSNVVVDLPVALAPWTEVVLRAASQIYLVTPMTIPAAHRLSRFLHLMHQEELGHLPLKIVVNRFNSSGKGAAIALSQFTKAIGRPVDHLVPNDYELVLQSHNHGQPAMRIKPQSAFAQAIEKMLLEDLGVSQLARQGRKFSLFGFS
ncbi:MAG: hypothetical protein KGJ78_14780 [Alphaproteobacteria bacterium]|nr:hypothetical protein [Alphaproteobacteria bacterium]